MDLINKDIEQYADAHAGRVDPLLDELERETIEKIGFANMLTGKAEGTLLKILVAISGARRVVEIGTFTGYSALMMAEALPEDGELTTLEISPDYARFAAEYFRRSRHGKKIRLLAGPALESLGKIPAGSIDFVFIDADKTSYPSYYEEAKRILKQGGIIAADNALWYGRVLDPRDEDSKAVHSFNKLVVNDPAVDKVLLTVRDGVYLIRKK